MTCTCKNKIRLVAGNTATLAIALQEETRTAEGTMTEDFAPADDDIVTVVLKTDYGPGYMLPTTVQGNVVTIENNGVLPVGTYGVEVVVDRADGSKRRFYQSTKVEIVNETSDAGIDDGTEFGVDSYTMQAVMIAGLRGEKGEKGDPGVDGPAGADGQPGPAGADGVGIVNIEYKETDTGGNFVYTITLSNGYTYDFTSPKGPAGASSWSDITGKPTFADVATSGDYDDLSNKPTIPTLPTLATVATTGDYDDLTNKPTIPTLPTLATVATTGDYDDLTNKPTIPTVPTISTDIASDATSNDKTASPKAVKTFVEGKGYTTNTGTLTGVKFNNVDATVNNGVASITATIPDVTTKADKVSNATNGNFASLDANGNLTDSGHKHSDYLTQHQSLSGYATETWVGQQGFLTQHQDITGKADKSEMSVTDGTDNDADKTTITLKSGLSATVLKSHQSLDGKEDAMELVTPTLSSNAFTAETGKYYTVSGSVTTLTVHLPYLASTTNIVGVVVYFAVGSSTPTITFDAVSGANSNTILATDGYSFDTDTTYEVNAIYNGVAWVLTATPFKSYPAT